MVIGIIENKYYFLIPILSEANGLLLSTTKQQEEEGDDQSTPHQPTNSIYINCKIHIKKIGQCNTNSGLVFRCASPFRRYSCSSF
mmetsp:Transcript_48100/g.70273  ORF Transcript_48100/g.70273 Transcript_48100/m.70273 type:complete len:85 (-) Transcript_48100:235-489(-)